MISLVSGDIDVKVTLPAGAVAGDTITVSNGTTSTPIVLTLQTSPQVM
ncbi:hypothetical protein ITG13_06235 [Vibrio cyclitrophicus]|nr:hypothetical protein [Vibrio cyclitrophicus]UPR48782.1 hypothetical protein ITG13_06235 [Vibrio cyclitrophicus]